ncbi:hypothetical protein VST7929_00284 [Vibrio stylophorae]|uniref:Uncharacterized protein n=1 Tax=Vibrio stylophorae TaxID=659351 RepID=A0ABM8ZQ95_9VIBR|nr:hypothetical protein VST7929_00284 [Vibrio stylophorae]
MILFKPNLLVFYPVYRLFDGKMNVFLENLQAK